MRYECRFVEPLKFSLCLSVCQCSEEPHAWGWHLLDEITGRVLYQGVTENVMSAQVSAQWALEQWLLDNRKAFGTSSNPVEFDWEQT
jgi:hypothetical protein